MSTRISINPSASPVAAQLLGVLSSLRQASDGLNALYEMGESAASGSDWAAFNAEFRGVNGDSSDTLYNLLVAARAAVNHADLDAILARVGQR